jgi:hypothetical protein
MGYRNKPLPRPGPELSLPWAIPRGERKGKEEGESVDVEEDGRPSKSQNPASNNQNRRNEKLTENAP